MKYRDRIVGLLRVRGDRILPHPKNFRLHPERQREAMRGVLADLGIGDALIVVPADEAKVREVHALKTPMERDAWLRTFDGSGSDVLLLDGHLRAEEIRDQAIPVLLLDLLPHEQAEFLALFDPIGDLAGFDRTKFLALAEDFNSTSPAVQQLVADLAKVDAANTELPEESKDEDGAADQSSEVVVDFAIVVTCKTEDEQITLIEEFMNRGLSCRALI